MIRCRQERPDESWQESKSLDDHSAFTWEAQNVFDDQTEALTAKPVKRLQHRPRRSIKPTLVHVHRHELVQQRTVVAGTPARVISHRFGGRVKACRMQSGYAAGDGRFARTASTADPIDVLKLFTERYRYER